MTTRNATQPAMLGAIVGDFVGSRYETRPVKTKDFEHDPALCVWTDDTVMTVALADAMANGSSDFAAAMRRFGVEHATTYGKLFHDWLHDPETGSYGSWGTGAAMRVSPAAWFATDFQTCMRLAFETAMPTHSHPEGVRGARAVAAAVFAALTGSSQSETRSLIERHFGYDLSPGIERFRADARPGDGVVDTVPRALACAIEATSFEDAVRTAVSLGGSADTEAAIAGAVAEGWFPVPPELSGPALARLPDGILGAHRRASQAAAGIARAPVTRADLDAWRPEPVPSPTALETPATDAWLEIERSLHVPAPTPGLLRRLTGALGFARR